MPRLTPAMVAAGLAASLAIAPAAGAQEPPAPPAAAEPGAVAAALGEIAALLRQQLAAGQAELLLRRAELARQALAPGEGELARLRQELAARAAERSELTVRYADLVQSLDGEADPLRALAALERLGDDFERRDRLAAERLAALEEEAAAADAALAAAREELAQLLRRADRALAEVAAPPAGD